MNLKIFVVDDDEMSLKITTGILKSEGFDVATAKSGDQALASIESETPSLAILDVLMPDMDGFELCRRLRKLKSTSNIPIIILTGLTELDERLKAFDAGADDFIPKPVDPKELLARVKVLIRRTIEVKPIAATQSNCETTAVFSLRGGSGVSTLAANISVGLRQVWDYNTALVDLSLANGQLAMMLDLPLRNSWGDLTSVPVEDMDPELIRRVLLNHRTGLDVLATSRQPEETELLTKEQVDYTLTFLKSQYEYLIIDLPHDFSNTTITALDASDRILLVLAPELASVQNASTALQTFERLGYPPEKIELILNWTFKGNGLSRAQIEKALKREIKVTIPNGGDMFATAITLGKPIPCNNPESPFTALFEDLAFHWSKEHHKMETPQKPKEGYLRVGERIRKRKEKK